MRKREHATNTHADIHEKDLDYLRTCRLTGKQAAEFYGWRIVRCDRDDAMRTIEDIHEEVFCLATNCLEG